MEFRKKYGIRQRQSFKITVSVTSYRSYLAKLGRIAQTDDAAMDEANRTF